MMGVLHWYTFDLEPRLRCQALNLRRAVIRHHDCSLYACHCVEQRLMVDFVVRVKSPAGPLSPCGVWWVDEVGGVPRAQSAGSTPWRPSGETRSCHGVPRSRESVWRASPGTSATRYHAHSRPPEPASRRSPESHLAVRDYGGLSERQLHEPNALAARVLRWRMPE